MLRARWRWWWRERKIQLCACTMLASWTPVTLLSHRHYYWHRRVRGSVAAIRIYVSSSSSSSVKVVCEWNALRCAAIIVVYTFLSPLLSFFFFYSISSFFQTLNLNALFVAFFLPLILTFIWFYFIDDAVKELPENLNMFSCNNDYDEA